MEPPGRPSWRSEVPLAPVAAGLALGIACAAAVPAALAAGPLLLAGSLLRRLRPLLWSALGGLLLGVAPGRAREPPPLLAHLDLPAVHSVEGVVRKVDPPAGARLQLLLDADRLGEGPASRLPVCGVLLTIEGSGAEAPALPRLAVGTRVRAIALLSRFPRPRNPGDQDRRAHQARRGVHLRGFVQDPRGLRILARASGPQRAVAALRRQGAATLTARLEARDAGLARALLLGDRGLIDRRDRRLFRETGQAHLLAVSGLHVGLLLGGLVWLLRRAGVGSRTTSVCGLAAALLYVPVAGAPPSAVRAGLGASYYFLGRLLERPPTGFVVLSVVAVLVLVTGPGSFYEASFRLSFGAVLAILLLARPLRRLFVRPVPSLPGLLQPPRAFARTALAVSMAAWLGTAPFAALHIGYLCPAAPLLALATLPLAAMLVGLGFLLLLLAPLDPLASIAAAGFEIAAATLRAVLVIADDIGLTSLDAAAPGPWWWAAYVAAIVFTAGGSVRQTLGGLCALVALVALLLLPPRVPAPTHPRLWLLDVGHGQAAVLLLPDGRACLIDAGSLGDPVYAGRRTARSLTALGVRELSLVVVSHADADHAGGIVEVARRVESSRCVLPPAFPSALRSAYVSAGLEPTAVLAGTALLEGAWGRLEVLAPERTSPVPMTTNDASLVVRLTTAAGQVLLLPGDVQAQGVEQMVVNGVDLRADVLVLPHHGLPGGGRTRLMGLATPDAWLASAGASAVATLPPRTICTAARGAIRVDLLPEGARVLTPYAGENRYHAPPIGMPQPLHPNLLAAHVFQEPLPLLLLGAALLIFAFVASGPLGWLTRGGAATAWVLGVVSAAAFGWAGVAGLFAPFTVATLLGKLPGTVRAGPRSPRQVISNGIPAFLGCVLALSGHPAWGLPLFLGGLACLGADTCATEIGVRWGGSPFRLVGRGPLQRGESGGVTALGLGASLLGALLAPAAYALTDATWTMSSPTVWACAAAGMAGGLLDSVLGGTLQYRGAHPQTGKTVEAVQVDGRYTARVSGWRLLDNDMVNLVAGLAAGLLGLGLAGLLGA